jgi:CDP-diacylglycerol---glycerol-3-phosphate 3-phosphatidyltransferase
MFVAFAVRAYDAVVPLAMKLTWLRIVLVAPGTAALMLGWPAVSLAIFVIACATDWADGYLARKTNTTSPLGAFLDPLADKLLVFLYFAVLQSMGAFPLWLFLCMLARDVINDAFRSFAASRKVILPANIWGKAKTTLQMVSLIAALILVIKSMHSFTMSATDIALLTIANGAMILALLCGVVGTMLFIRAGKSVLR